MTVSAMKRQAKASYNTYKRSNMKTLEDAYKTCSRAKHEAFNKWWWIYHKMQGRNLRVISKNCNFFSLGFEYDDEETGEPMFMHITASYHIAVPLKEIAGYEA